MYTKDLMCFISLIFIQWEIYGGKMRGYRQDLALVPLWQVWQRYGFSLDVAALPGSSGCPYGKVSRQPGWDVLHVLPTAPCRGR